MTITLSAQASAIETARRIINGGAKGPKIGSSEARFLAMQLDRAAETIRNLDMEQSHGAQEP